VRPTASKIRQAFFNILGPRIAGARFIDVCAGSGLMGLEALSRGAASLIAIEEDRQLVRAIEANIKRLGYEAEVICGDLKKVLPVLEAHSGDIIFADPPYKSGLDKSVLCLVARGRLLSPDGIMAIERAASSKLSGSTAEAEDDFNLENFDNRKYGQTIIGFYRWQGRNDAPDNS
jgi:16S rRNA (guanine966-N2)-methyltransferase